MNPLPDDPETLRLLDDYLARLQAGEQPDRAALLAAHPELGSALLCLEALEGMAPPDDAADDAAADDAAADDGPAEPPDTPAEAGELPRSFGPYDLLGEIGRGGMGVVYKARQKDLDRVVALKMILASHLASPEHVRRFQVEARAAARLRHSNIVHIHEVGQHHGQHYFTMEYVEGESLAERLAREPLPIEAAVRIVGAVARAVEHLHQQGIIHRDLKPSNILLDRDAQPYVTDFGLAKLFEPGAEMTATGVIAGTPSYMAPEQASGHFAEVGPAADVYSLGAILYELLTGRPPFSQENRLDVFLDILGREPALLRQLNPKVPAGLELVCLKCLAKAPGDRYASAAALADELDRFARGEPLVVRPPRAGQRLQQWARRQPALAMRLAALSVFYAVGTFNYLCGAVSGDFQAKMSIAYVAWMAASLACQQLLGTQRWSLPARFVWGLFDSILLLTVLLLGNGAMSPLVIGYPILVAGAGLWFRVRFVWFMTALSLVSYGVLVYDLYHWRPGLRAAYDPGPTHFVIFAIGLVVLGSIVSYLVHRVRTLSSFCGRQLP
jgi:serine/threonine-protein kinase